MYNRIKKASFFLLLLFSTITNAQTVTQKLEKAFRSFEADPQLESAISALYVVEAGTGNIVFEKNARIGLAPASTQKIITAAAAYELLGKDFRYRTTFGYSGMIRDGVLNGNISIKPSGDPSFGSWRWQNTSEEKIIGRLVAAIKNLGIRKYRSVIVDKRGWEGETVPDGWIWQDIGNYYGAGAEALNWRENQFDLVLKSGPKVGDRVAIVKTVPQLYGYRFRNYATAGPKGSGDNSYIYQPLGGDQPALRGTIPAGEDRFVVSGAFAYPNRQFVATLMDSLSKSGVQADWIETSYDEVKAPSSPDSFQIFHEEVSPPLDSLVYWFLKKSINLYGEAFVKTFAAVKGQAATTDNGTTLIKAFWKEKGIAPASLRLVDGSGLSPLNRITAEAQVKVLRYARQQPWFEGYYYAYPEYNGMKMKSGTISGVKSFCGYHRSASGQTFIFSFLVNNYNGSAATLVQKMYKVLDELK